MAMRQATWWMATLIVSSAGAFAPTRGEVLVIDRDAGTGRRGALFRVDPVSGSRDLLSDFGSGANPGDDPSGVVAEADGRILVIDFNGGTDFRGALFRVDPISGSRDLLSDFGSGANPGESPVGVAVETDGRILVIDGDAATIGRGALFRVDPVSGSRELLSDFGIGANPGPAPTGVAVEADGRILVIDAAAGTGPRGALFRVDPVSGGRTVLSDFGIGANPGPDPNAIKLLHN